MRRFLVDLTGADPALLEQARETTKYERMGGTVVTTAVLAAISATFALRTALDAPLVVALVLGCSWGVAILNLDSWIVTASKRLESWWGNVAAAVPRLLLALVLGFVISEPLVLQAFAAEIDAELTVMRAEEQAAFDEQLTRDPRFARLAQQQEQAQELEDDLTPDAADRAVVDDPDVRQAQAEYDRLSEELRDAQRRTACEGEGTCGSGQTGAGQRFDNARETQRRAQGDVDRARTALQQAREVALQDAARETQAHGETVQRRLDEVRRDIADGERERQRAIDENAAEVAASDGLLAQMDALERVSDEKPHLAVARWFLFAVLLVIECTPTLLKLMINLGPPSEYDKLLSLESDAVLHRKALELWGQHLQSQMAVEHADAERRTPLRAAVMEQEAALQEQARGHQSELDAARLQAHVELETLRVQAETEALTVRMPQLLRGIELWGKHEKSRQQAEAAVAAEADRARAQLIAAREATAISTEAKLAVHRLKVQEWQRAQEPVTAQEVQDLIEAGRQEARARAAETALRQARTQEESARLERDAARERAELCARTAQLEAEAAQAQQARDEAAREAAAAAREAAVHAAARADQERRRAESERRAAEQARLAATEAAAAAEAERARLRTELVAARSVEAAAESRADAAAAERARLESEREAAVVAREVADLGAQAAQADLARARTAGAAAQAARAAAEQAAAAARQEELADSARRAAHEARVAAERAAREQHEEAAAAAVAERQALEAQRALADLLPRQADVAYADSAAAAS